MLYRYFIQHKKKSYWVFKYKDVLIFPNSGKSNFPYSNKTKNVSYEKIILNIDLEKGLNKKILESHYKKRFN